jgi:hypothetical protein
MKSLDEANITPQDAAVVTKAKEQLVACRRTLKYGCHQRPRSASAACHTQYPHAVLLTAPNGCLIEAPWLVNGGHGAPMRQQFRLPWLRGRPFTGTPT